MDMEKIMRSFSDGILRGFFARQYLKTNKVLSFGSNQVFRLGKDEEVPVTEIAFFLGIPIFEIEYFIREGLLSPDDPEYFGSEDIKGLLCFLTGDPATFYYERN